MLFYNLSPFQIWEETFFGGDRVYNFISYTVEVHSFIYSAIMYLIFIMHEALCWVLTPTMNKTDAGPAITHFLTETSLSKVVTLPLFCFFLLSIYCNQKSFLFSCLFLLPLECKSPKDRALNAHVCGCIICSQHVGMLDKCMWMSALMLCWEKCRLQDIQNWEL